jgi:hypothetical protein
MTFLVKIQLFELEPLAYILRRSGPYASYFLQIIDVLKGGAPTLFFSEILSVGYYRLGS